MIKGSNKLLFEGIILGAILGVFGNFFVAAMIECLKTNFDLRWVGVLGVSIAALFVIGWIIYNGLKTTQK